VLWQQADIVQINVTAGAWLFQLRFTL